MNWARELQQAIWEPSWMHALDPAKFGHQLKSSNFFFGKCGFQTPGLVPLDSSRNSVLFGGIYVSGTPIWTRIGQKSILGHPFQKKVLKYARILLGYMEYHGDLVRHSLLKYWYEVGTKFDDCGAKFVEPAVIKYRP